MRCLGTLEFLCDFHNMCHNTQKTLESTLMMETNKESKEKLESDTESDKENILPCKYGKRKGKLLQLEQIKFFKIVDSDDNIQKTEILNEQSIDKTNDSITLQFPDSNCMDILKQNLNMDSCCKPDSQEIEIGIVSDIDSIHENSQINKTLFSDSIIEIKNKNSTRQSLLIKHGKKEKKKNILSKTFPIISKNKEIDKQLNKTIHKYFTVPSHNNVNILTNTNANENVEQENIIFEGTVIDSSGDTSIIMPLKAESYSNELRLDNIVMADGSEIVQAQEIVWISNNFELTEPEKPKSINSNQSKTISPAPGDEAETIETEETLIVQTSEQGMKSTNSSEQLIVFEVELPTKEHSITLPKTFANSRKNRSISITSAEHRYNEGKFSKISELMTDKQKKDIETHYSIDMTLVHESEVVKNIITLDKCKFKCKICEVIYPRLDKCQVHIWRHLDMKPYICKVCNFSTLTVSNIRCHIRKSHLKIKPFQCHLCNKCYNSATLLEEHINIHTGSRPYQCNFCEFASTSKQVLAHHILIHKSKKDIICDICGKAFYSKGRMRAHKITHNKEQAFKCTLCSTYVLHEEALERHYMNVHMQDYVCKTCNKVYKSRKALHNHESVHSDAKFECPMCPNVYKSTHILKEHILKHQGIRQYKCNSCHKSFAQQSHLAAHMAVHSNITYNCPGCQKGFNRHDNMKVHTKRCEKFLANPELQNLLTKRKISFSKNHTAKACLQKINNSDEIKKHRKKVKNGSKKIAIEKPVVECIQSNDNDILLLKTI